RPGLSLTRPAARFRDNETRTCPKEDMRASRMGSSMVVTLALALLGLACSSGGPSGPSTGTGGDEETGGTAGGGAPGTGGAKGASPDASATGGAPAPDAAPEADGPPASGSGPTAGMTKLDDGMTLNNFEQGTPMLFTVKDGALDGNGTTGGALLITKNDYADFRLIVSSRMVSNTKG